MLTAFVLRVANFGLITLVEKGAGFKQSPRIVSGSSGLAPPLSKACTLSGYVVYCSNIGRWLHKNGRSWRL